MLNEIRVQNFAIVEDQCIQFQEGMSVFTGETGAGKSLLLDAITLLLGAKADTSLVRSGAVSAEVEGVFDWSDFPDRVRAASEMGFHFDEEETEFLVVRREISAQEKRKNRIWIQGKSATRSQLQKLLGHWVEISGQHEFLRLNREEYILETLDQYASLGKLSCEYQEKFQRYQEMKKKLNALEEIESERASLLDFRRYQLEEFRLAKVGPQLVQEEEELSARRQELSHVEKIRKSLFEVQNTLRSRDSEIESSSLLEQIKRMSRELSAWEKLDERYERASSLVEQSYSALLDLDSLVEELQLSVLEDPEDLEETEQRLSLIAKLKRKYNTNSEGLCRLLEEFSEELEKVENSSLELKKLRSEHEKLFEILWEKAQKLHQKRVQAAQKYSAKWQEQVQSLGIKDAQIDMRLELNEELSAAGLTRARVYFSANKGESTKLVSKVASGGELSRILLAMKYLSSDRNSVGFYLFDEVDSGIGGETAHRVGQKLKYISLNNQVIVVSHLAQVAAYSDSHFYIEKSSGKTKTQTRITALSSKEEKLTEISRMLGSSRSKAAKALADELILQASQHSF